MPIDFHDPANRRTYAGRTADAGWGTAVAAIVDPRGLDVVDVGCGGGTYLRAWRRLGARRVVGLDLSAMRGAGLREAAARPLWEVRERHASREALLQDLAARRGRSILHELDDVELDGAVAAVRAAVPDGPVVEEDRWTLWAGRR